MHTSKLQYNYISDWVNIPTAQKKKKQQRISSLQFLEETKNIMRSTSWSQNPGHTPREPDHSCETFCLDSL